MKKKLLLAMTIVLSIILILVLVYAFSDSSSNTPAVEQSSQSSKQELNPHEKLKYVADVISPAQVMEGIFHKIQLNRNMTRNEFNEERYGFSSELFSQYMINGPKTNIQVKELSIFLANDEDSLAQIEVSLKNYVKRNQELWGTQSIRIKSQLDSYKILKKDLIIVLLILEDAEEYRVIENEFKRFFDNSIPEAFIRKQLNKISGTFISSDSTSIQIDAIIGGVKKAYSISKAEEFEFYPQAPTAGEKIEINLSKYIFEDDVSAATAFSCVVYSEAIIESTPSSSKNEEEPIDDENESEPSSDTTNIG